jgi:hypothetical protein
VVSAAKSAVPTAQPSVARGTEVSTPGLSKETLSGVLDYQRQAIEAQHEQELSDLETNFLAQLHGIQADATNFKNKFLEMSGTQMQALLDAKTEARKEVVKEMAAEKAALEEVKEKKKQAVATVEATEKRVVKAEAEAEEARRDAERYKFRMTMAMQEAKEEVEQAALAKVQFVMRNAAMELRDQTKKIEVQQAAATQRKMAEAVKLAEAKMSSHLRSTIRALEQQQALNRAQTQTSASTTRSSRSKSGCLKRCGRRLSKQSEWLS